MSVGNSLDPADWAGSREPRDGGQRAREFLQRAAAEAENGFLPPVTPSDELLTLWSKERAAVERLEAANARHAAAVAAVMAAEGTAREKASRAVAKGVPVTVPVEVERAEKELKAAELEVGACEALVRDAGVELQDALKAEIPVAAGRVQALEIELLGEARSLLEPLVEKLRHLASVQRFATATSSVDGVRRWVAAPDDRFPVGGSDLLRLTARLETLIDSTAQQRSGVPDQFAQFMADRARRRAERVAVTA